MKETSTISLLLAFAWLADKHAGQMQKNMMSPKYGLSLKARKHAKTYANIKESM